MRTHLALTLFLCSCGSSQGEPTEPVAPADPIATSEPTATPTASATAEAKPETKPEEKPDAGEEWSIETGNAKGVTLDNDTGGSLALATLAWTKFLRKTKPLGNAAMPNANVSFGSVTADGAVASDVVCALPAWADFPKDPTTLAATLIPLVAKDSVPAASLAKIKPALLACNAGKQVRVEWEFKESKFVGAKVDGADAKTNTCVKNAVAKAFMMDSGVCAATIAP